MTPAVRPGYSFVYKRMSRLAKTAARAPAPDYDLGAQVGHLLRRAHQRHAALFQEMMADIDLTPTQFAALVKIGDLGRVSQNELGRLTAMDPATIQGVVRRLTTRRLVTRGGDPADRRFAVLSLTAAGRAVVAAAIERGRAITAATLAPLGAADQSRLVTLLKKLT